MTHILGTAPQLEVTRTGRSPMAVDSVLPLISTYAIAFIFIFFVMGGYLPAPATRTSSAQATSSSADTISGQLFQGLTWALAITLMLPYTRKILDAAARMKAMVGISVVAIASSLWSQDPASSLRRGIFLTLGTALAFYLVRRFSTENLAQILVLTGLVSGVLSIFVSVALPQYGIDTFNGGAWEGIFRSKNGCAQIMLFFLSAAACFRFKTQGMELLRWSLYPVAGLLIVMSRATTGWIFAPGLLLLAACLSGLRRMERRSALFLLASGLIAVVAGAVAMSYVMPFILEILGKDPGMSGRLPLWLAAIASALKRPLLGYGYAAFWTGLRGESLSIFMSTHFEIAQAQNGLLEVWLELGLAGVALILLTLIRAVKDAFVCLQYAHSQETNWYITLLVFTVAYNVDETFLATAHSLPWLLYVVACTGLADRVRQIRMTTAPQRESQSNFVAIPRLRPAFGRSSPTI